MKTRDFPRAVAVGGGAGLAFLAGLAVHLRGGGQHHQHDLLTAIVPGAADMEEAESLLGPCACVLPATVDAGPVRRAYPETFTHATAIGPIIHLQLALSPNAKQRQFRHSAFGICHSAFRVRFLAACYEGVTPGTLVPLTAVDC